ncbi:MBL fold metallo-hydrolase [Candidatus Latescibacterota bacterium]
MKICLLASGSKGNSMYIESHDTALIIDQGISHKELIKRMTSRGLDSEKIKAILVTHEHSDHIRGVGISSRCLGIPVYATIGSLSKMDSIFNGSEQVIPIESGITFNIGSMEIHPFNISHDAEDPVQYCILAGKKKISVVTDIGFMSTLVTERIKNSDLLVIEANHDVEMLLTGSYPWQLKQRVKGRTGHLSNRNAAETIFNISKNGLPKIILAHLSEENNRADVAERAVRELFEKHDRKLGFLMTASQTEPTPIIAI